MSTPIESPVLTLDRAISLPRERVFRAWLEPALAERWWGPVCELDGRRGGRLHLSAFGKSTEGRFLEVAEPETLVFSWLRADLAALHILSLTDTEEGTHLRLEAVVVRGDSAEGRRILQADWTQALSRLPNAIG